MPEGHPGGRLSGTAGGDREVVARGLPCARGSRVRRSSTSEAAGKITTDSRPAAMSAAALAGVTDVERQADRGRGDDERQRGGLHEAPPRAAARAGGMTER